MDPININETRHIYQVFIHKHSYILSYIPNINKYLMISALKICTCGSSGIIQIKSSIVLDLLAMCMVTYGYF